MAYPITPDINNYMMSPQQANSQSDEKEEKEEKPKAFFSERNHNTNFDTKLQQDSMPISP